VVGSHVPLRPTDGALSAALTSLVVLKPGGPVAPEVEARTVDAGVSLSRVHRGWPAASSDSVVIREGTPYVPIVDVFNILRTVVADGALKAHLAPYNWRERPDVTTLCRLPVRGGPPTTSFQRNGCVRCAVRAVGVGIEAVREANGVVVNLSRFVDVHCRGGD
jgi:hypothetical protein